MGFLTNLKVKVCTLGLVGIINIYDKGITSLSKSSLKRQNEFFSINNVDFSGTCEGSNQFF